jgi:hypothetical protein
MTASQAVEVVEFGPRAAEARRTFQDRAAFTDFMTETICQLQAGGFVEYPFPERRGDADRRFKPRRPDRRRAVRALAEASGSR